jgi:hypothetical protein
MASARLRSGEGTRLAVLPSMLAEGWEVMLPRASSRTAAITGAVLNSVSVKRCRCCAVQVRHQRLQPQAPP